MPYDADCIWVAVNRPDGPAHLTPVWFVVVDDAFWFSTPLAARKAELLRADPRISLAVEGSSGSGGEVVQGRAEPVDTSERPDVLQAFAAKYQGWDAADPAPWGERMLVRVQTDRWLLGGPNPAG